MKRDVSIKKKIVEITGIPEEVLLGVPILSMIGTQEIIISNYRGILEYTDILIRIQTKCCQIKINGLNLCIKYYTADEMKITGDIIDIHYENKGE